MNKAGPCSQLHFRKGFRESEFLPVLLHPSKTNQTSKKTHPQLSPLSLRAAPAEGGRLSFQQSRVGQGVAGLRGALLPSHREILSTSHLPGGPWWDEVREGRHHTHQVCRSQSCSAPMGSCIPWWFHGWFLWPVSVTVLPTPVRCQRQTWPFTALIQGKGRGIHLLPCLSSLSYALMRPEMYILFSFQVALDVTSEKLCQNNWYGGRK